MHGSVSDFTPALQSLQGLHYRSGPVVGRHGVSEHGQLHARGHLLDVAPVLKLVQLRHEIVPADRGYLQVYALFGASLLQGTHARGRVDATSIGDYLYACK